MLQCELAYFFTATSYECKMFTELKLAYLRRPSATKENVEWRRRQIKKSAFIDESEKSASVNHSPNHSYDVVDADANADAATDADVDADADADAVTDVDKNAKREPIVTKVEDLMKLAERVQNLRRRQNIPVDILQERFDVNDDDDVNYDAENDDFLQATVNVPIIKNRQNHRQENDAFTTSKTSKSTVDSSEFEEKNFPLKRRNDITHAQYGKYQHIKKVMLKYLKYTHTHSHTHTHTYTHTHSHTHTHTITNKFCAIGFFNEADTLESSSILIYSE
jgi:hypothetical protein